MNLKIYLVAMMMTTFLLTGCQPAGSPGTKASDCYQVEFLDVTETSEVASVWRYQVEELPCAQDLSNWMLELPACAILVDASPAPWENVQPDPTYKMNGIKWQTGTDFQSGEFRVALSGDLITGMTRAGVKGPDTAIFTVTGPACRGTTPTASTGTVTLSVSTNTAVMVTDTPPVPTSVPPTNTVPPPQPPASAGLILITDNDQTLTFTCSSDQVEVRGNANVITLLGSCSSITIKGNGNRVYWQSGSPTITDTGNENIITRQ